MACHIKINTEKAKALSALERYCGSNCSQFYTYLTTVIKNINADGTLEFTPDFKLYWSGKEPLDINTSDPEKVKNTIIKYFNSKYPDVRDGVRKTKSFDKVKTYGYTSVSAREEAKRLFANKMIEFYHRNENVKHDKVTENLKKYYVERAMAVFTKTLSRRLAKITGVSAEEIESNLLIDNNANYINKLLKGHESNINLQLENLIALYNEYSSTKLDEYDEVNPRQEFIDEVMYDSRLGDIRIDKNSSLDDLTMESYQEEVAEENSEVSTDDITKDAEYDTYIQTLNSTMGIGVTYMTHIGAPIRSLLGSLKKKATTDTPGEYIPDTDNYLGIADVMDANLCATVLYHYGRYENPSEMLKSIKEIAAQMPGFAAFNDLYNILAGDLNLQAEFYRVFKKCVMGKLEVVVENGVGKGRISNSGIDKEGILKFQYINGIKGTALSVYHEGARKSASILSTRIQDYKQDKDIDGREIRDICTSLAEQFKEYYPTIDDLSIRNFVLQNKNKDCQINYRDNLNLLYSKLSDTINGAIETEQNFKEHEGKLYVAARHNLIAKKQREENGDENVSPPIDLNPLYAESYISSKSESAATSLSKMLIPYSLVSSPLNSRNVHGNQSSDVINDSMMTNIKATLESRLNTYSEEVLPDGTKRRVWDKNAPIVRLGEHRFKSKQYDFSPILLEHREGDVIINRGLFKEEQDEKGNVRYVPTDYFDELVKVTLFNGASNLDDGSNISYSQMSKGDYIGTAWRSFFGGANSVENASDSADYFMRIPSDAPKTFVITAPRYSTADLLSIGNEKEINKQITDFINKVSAVSIDGSTSAKYSDFPIVVSKHGKNLNLNTFVEHLRTVDGKTTNIRIPANRRNSLRNDREKKVRIAFRYAPTKDSTKDVNVYVMEGTYYDGTLHDAKFVGFYNDTINDDIWGDIRNSIWDTKRKLGPEAGGIKWTVDTNHVVFKQFRNIFRQELTDMATAASVMFKTVKDRKTGNYRIQVRDGKPVLNVGKLITDNTNHNGLHPVYHFAETKDGKNPLYVQNADGSISFTGKVFTSDRFILYDYFAENGEDAIKNFGEQILSEAFNLLRQQGTDPNLVLQFDKNGNVVLTEEQQAIIDKYITNFILAYIEHGRVRTQGMQSFMQSSNGLEVDTKSIADFMLNTHLAYVGFNDLFEGDTKFYKDTQTFLKRAKESQGSGVPYGIVDITKPIQPGHNELAESPLKGITFAKIDADGKQSPYIIKAYDTFSGITVYNTVKTDTNMLDTLVSYLTNPEYMKDAVLTKDAAETLLYGENKKGGYTETTVNDAQSYITFDEWVRRITARGQLPKYRRLIDKILDESQDLTVNDIQEFIQVQKNFYYDQYYNEDTKTVSPRQIKNAEFVLVPRLVKGTELEKVAQLMDKLGVDQLNTVETSKAGQSYRFTLWDETGNISQDILDDLNEVNEEYKSDIMINGEAAKEFYSYNYLYTQQETTQHINDENKAGIQIMKKIVDNIDENSPEELKKAKKEFFDIYSANIRKSFERLMKRFKVELDDDGNVVLDKAGNIKGLDYKVFFDALKEELTRLGLDANMLDYCTQDPNSTDPSKTIMPNYMSLVASKFENVVQSLFNHSITRQTLPGFHAAQITGMGFRRLSEIVDRSRTSNILQYHPQLYINEEGKKITEREYNLLDSSEKSKYKKDGIANYVEIMLPASAFGYDRSSERFAGLSREEQDAIMLAELQELGVDEIIGYRIPTEGKQSVCNMKVVGFTDDAYGSTIVVPDAWVSQTGSDFDIDSVYGIQYPLKFDKNGIPKRYNYKTSFDKYDWFDYIRVNTGFKEDGINDKNYQEALDEVKEERRAQKLAFAADNESRQAKLQDDEQEAYANLCRKAKDEIIRTHRDIRETLGKKLEDLTREEYLYQLREEYDNLDELIEMNEDFDNPMSPTDIGYIKVYQEAIKAIAEDIIAQEKFDFDFSGLLNAKLQEIRNAQIDKYSKEAKENGLLSLEDYLEQANKSPELFNSRGARNTRLLDNMRLMLTHPASLEENLSRSNFDDIKASLKKCIVGSTSIQRKARTAYNIFDQAEYQEDAMSGAKLKAFSVVRDTFCSICNTVRPSLMNNSEIRVFYSGDKYNETTLKKRFGDDNVISSKGGFIVTHRTFGWSNDNKNIEGKILTAYSSQTTAHILDAIKSGNVPNVNDLTFQVYKTFVDVGSNYDTAISFISQPGVTRIVDAYNATNSIYAEERGRNYVLNAVRSILDDLNIEYEASQKIDDLLAIVNNTFGKTAEDIFGKGFEFSVLDEDNAQFVLDAEQQIRRLAEDGEFKGDGANVKRLLYDLQIILQYNKINNLAENIRSAAQVSNPDKFGAKQTIFATRQVFDNIVRVIQDNINVDARTKEERNNFRLQVDGKNIISVLYPGLEEVEKGEDALNKVISDPDFVNNSAYKPLAAFLKYATATSIKINKTLFITQSDDFVALITDPDIGLASILSGNNRITEKVAKDFQNYIVNYIVMQSEFLQAPLSYNMGKGGSRGFEYIGKGTRIYNEDEATRVFGYGYPPGTKVYRTYINEEKQEVRIAESFTVKDINNPTQEEVNDFNTMSPAQKITWVKGHFRYAGVFKYINTQLFNESSTRGKKAGTQTMTFDEDAANIETVRKEFEEAFSHKNPLIACAAADIIKYSFFVEGYRMGMNNVSKIIANSTLLNGGRLYGTNIVSNSNDKMAKLDSAIDSTTRQELIDCFVRGHSTSIGINTHNVRRPNGKAYELPVRNQGLIHLNGTTLEGRTLAEKYGIIYIDSNGRPQTNSFVRLRYGNKTTLYRITEHHPVPNITTFFLIPLNELEPNEKAKWSANSSNNKYYSEDYYNELIERYNARVAELADEGMSYHRDILAEEVKNLEQDIDKYKPEAQKKIDKTVARPIVNFDTNPSFSRVTDPIREWYPTAVADDKPKLHVWNTVLSDYVVSFGKAGQTIQKVTLPDGSTQNFSIYKVNIDRLRTRYTGDNITAPISKPDKKYSDIIALIRQAASYNSENLIQKHFGDIYCIEPTDESITDDDLMDFEGIDFSTIADVAVNSTKAIFHRGKDSNDKEAGKISQFWKDRGIVATNKGVENNIEDVIINTAKYLENIANDIERDLKYFIKDPDGDGYLPVDDIKCINIVKKDPRLRKRYLQLLLEPSTIVEEFGVIKDLDIDSEDQQLQGYLEKIKKAVDKMQNLPIVANAQEKFTREYYDKATDNPLVRQGLISVLDGFYRTNWANAMFNDIQETSNPIIQLAMKNFQADLRAKEMQSRRQADEFIKHIDGIRAKAKANGARFDLNKVIDEYGRFKQNYNKKLTEDRDKLQKAERDAAAEYGRGSIEHLKAYLAYNEWKAAYIEQEYATSYYVERNAALHKILYGTYAEYDPYKEEYDAILEQEQDEIRRGLRSPEELSTDNIDSRYADAIAKYFSKYESLRYQRAELYRQITSDIAREDIDKEIDKIDDRMTRMLYPMSEDELTNICADNLKDYIATIRGIEQKYFKYDPIYNFEDNLERNLKIVQSYEMSGRPSSLYANNKEYVKAKTWLRQNAILEPDYGSETQKVKQDLEKAYSVLKQPKDTKAAEKLNQKLYSKVKRAYRDENGEFDPRLVPASTVKLLQEQQAKLYRNDNEHPFSDKTLISNSEADETIYNYKFYNGMRGTRSKSDSPRWAATVTKINELLSPFYNEHSKEIELERIPNTNNEQDLAKYYSKETVDEIREKYGEFTGTTLLKELRSLYDVLQDIRGGKKSKTVRKFIEQNVKFDYNKSKYDSDYRYAKGLPKGQFRTALLDLISDDDYNGGIQANNYLYGILKPVDSKLDEFTDKERTEALATINKYKGRKLKAVYLEAKTEARRTMSENDYHEWIAMNHVYNPYTHSYEPIDMWWESYDKADNYKYYPKYPASVRTIRDGYYTAKEISTDNNGKGFEYDDGEEVRDVSPEEADGMYFPNADFRNKNYKENAGHAGNYKFGSNPEYDNKSEANKYEVEAMDYMQEVLLTLANTQDSEKYFKNGWLPSRRIGKPVDTKGWVKEIAKVFGWANEPYNPNDWYNVVSPAKDRDPQMPMLERLKGKGYKEVPKKPEKKENQTDEDYAAELVDWEREKADIEANNMEIHKALLDKDWVNVIADFIVRAGTYNAVQDNKYELFYARHLIQNHGAYVIGYNRKGQKRFKRDSANSTDTDSEYLKQQDKYLIQQFDNQLRRILYNQFKKPNDTRLMKWMSTLQSLTSAQYMMLNVKGGIANVTLGESQIMGEAFAKEFFGLKDYVTGKHFYNAGVHDYILHSTDDKSGTVQGAIIKFMEIVDYDERTGVSRLTKDAYEVLRRMRDFGYTPQTAGEHGMQNSAMFSMMNSHRLFINPRHDEFGQPLYIYKNIAEYTRDIHTEALKSVLTDEEKEEFDKYVEKQASDANDFKEFAWFQKDLATEFAKAKLDKTRQKQFVEAREKARKNLEKEFYDDAKHPTILSQCALGKDGKLTFKDESLLAQIDIPKANGDPSDAYQLLGSFKGRVISVNKYIHGVYDKSGRAQIENTFFGSLLMQYHKHLPVGIMKRYRSQGMWSEERGAVAKGMYRSLADYLSIPFRNHKTQLELAEEEVNALEGVQNLLRNIVDFALNFRLNYRLMPEYDRANIRRMRGDICGVLAALFVTVAVRMGFDDDDEEGLVYNLALYEADRLASEAGQYMPFVAYSEAKKLWQSPIAAGSGISDLLSSANLLTHMIFDGDTFDGTYHSGKFAGESKLKVYVERRIPIWRGIRTSFIDIKTNNKFYKVGENFLGIANVNERVDNWKKH